MTENSLNCSICNQYVTWAHEYFNPKGRSINVSEEYINIWWEEQIENGRKMKVNNRVCQICYKNWYDGLPEIEKFKIDIK
jgi:hypothetical protein